MKKRMTLKRFFEIARRVKWRVRSIAPGFQSTEVRTGRNGGTCPLAYVDGQYGLVSPVHTAHSLGLPVPYANRIADAADSELSIWRPWLLKRLGIA